MNQGSATRTPAADPDAAEHSYPDLATVEAVIQHTGALTLVHWLIDSGWLAHEAYEQWRYGELPTLEDGIGADTDALAACLAQAEASARALGLVNEPQVYYDWRPSRADRVLTLSSDPSRAARLGQRWSRGEKTVQLDLFMDSGPSIAETHLIHHLAAHSVDAAATAGDRLCRLSPGHPGLGGFDTLIVYARHLADQPQIDADQIDTEFAALTTEIAPLAGDLLRGQARDYLAPAWRRLARALPLAAFDPAAPERHASYAWSRLPDHARTIASIEAVADHADHPALLRRLALALQHSGAPTRALLAWARSLELDPEAGARALEHDGPPRLRQHWQAFEDLDAELEIGDFPAWLLAREPGLLALIEADSTLAPRSPAFRAVRELVAARRRGSDELPARQALQARAPQLLHALLEHGHHLGSR